jgi:DNA-binding NarL/FixJ family response regulator
MQEVWTRLIAMLHLDVRPPSQKTALVVGPDPKIATEVSATLPDWNIERAANNLSALAMIQARPFDLVLTGENTSGKADVELLRKIRRIRPHLRLIILANESTPADVIASMREHAFSYFSTPFSPASFAEMIQLATEGQCWDDGVEVLSASPAWVRLAAPCDKRTADRLMQFFHEIVDLPECERDDVAAAFREMLLNAIEHGACFDPGQYVEISYIRGRHIVMCRVKDPGAGFTLEEIQHAAIANPPDDPLRHQMHRDAQGLRPGGFGLLLTRSLVDELIFGEKGNEVLLIKYLNLQQERTA